MIWKIQKLKQNKQIDNNCYIPDLEHAFSNGNDGGLNQV